MIKIKLMSVEVHDEIRQGKKARTPYLAEIAHAQGQTDT
jgi:hypothetical protein